MGFRIPHFQLFPPLASIIFLSFLIFQHPPCPRRVPYRQVEPVTQGTSPRRARGLPPFPVPPGFSPRGCKGRSPLHEITLGSPFPPGRGSGGGWGQKSKLKSGAAGNPKGKPPLWIPEWHGQPATSRASPPPGAPTAGRAGNGAAHLPVTVIISCGKCDIFPKMLVCQ